MPLLVAFTVLFTTLATEACEWNFTLCENRRCMLKSCFECDRHVAKCFDLTFLFLFCFSRFSVPSFRPREQFDPKLHRYPTRSAKRTIASLWRNNQALICDRLQDDHVEGLERAAGPPTGADEVVRQSNSNGSGRRLDPQHPVLDGRVVPHRVRVARGRLVVAHAHHPPQHAAQLHRCPSWQRVRSSYCLVFAAFAFESDAC